MRLITELFQGEVLITQDEVTELIIENPHVMYELIKDIYNQAEGNEGITYLSDDNSILKMSKSVELITTFVPFEINEKRLLTKINNTLEKEALNEVHYSETMSLLSDIERYLLELSVLFPCDLSFQNISIASVIKAAGVAITDDSVSDMERVFNYMNLVRDLLGEKVFVFVNMNSFFSYSDICSFVDTVVVHGFYVLLIEGKESDKIKGVRRIVVDKDLCVF